MTAQAPLASNRDSLELVEVFPSKAEPQKQQPLDSSCDATDCSSSSLLASTTSTNSGSILRVATLEESLSHVDIERSSSSSRELAEEGEEGDQQPQEQEAQEEDSSSSSNNKNHQNNNKSVTFTNVQVREYPICLGDNPAVMMGAPLSIGWEVQYEGKLSLDDYETARPDRRRSEELRIPSFVRETMLKNSGYSRLDIQKGVKHVNIARNRRRRTNETHRLHGAQEVAERLVRASLNATVRRSQKKQEKELIEHFRQEAAALQTQHKANRRATWSAAAASMPKEGGVAAPSSSSKPVQQRRKADWHRASV